MMMDTNIDGILGLVVLYQYIQTESVGSQQQIQNIMDFSTKALAYYLHGKCLPFTSYCHFQQSSSSNEFRPYKQFITRTQQLFITDLLLFISFLKENRRISDEGEGNKYCEHPKTNSAELDISEMVKLLQKLATEHLTSYRQIEARDFDSVATIVTTDFEALYLFKCGDYQQCLQLTAQNTKKLLFACNMPAISTFPNFIQLLDDDIVSVIALTLIINPRSRNCSDNICISQLTLSLYLMTQCQLQLRHSVTSMVQTLEYIKVAQRRHPIEHPLNQLTLKSARHKAITFLTTRIMKRAVQWLILQRALRQNTRSRVLVYVSAYS